MKYFVDMMVGNQFYASSARNEQSKPWTKREANREARKLNARKYQQLDQPKAHFQVRETP